MATQTLTDNADFAPSPYSVGDTAVVTGKSTGNVTSIGTNVDQSALGAGGLAYIYVTDRFWADIGTNAVPLKVEIGTMFEYRARSGNLYYVPNGTANTCAKFRALGGPSSKVNINGTGTLTVYEMLSGTATLAVGIAATTIRLAGGSTTLDGAAGTSPTTVDVGGSAVFRTLRGIAGGGNLNLFDRGHVIMDGGTDTVPTVTMTGGSADWVSSGTITTMNMKAGDAMKFKIGQAITITTLNIWPTVRNRNKFLDQIGLLLTVTNLNKDIDAIEAALAQQNSTAAY